MKIGDIYINKNNDYIIQIDSFASHMGKNKESSIIIFRQIERHNEFEIGSVPACNGWGTIEEIENEYELLIPQEKLSNYSDWEEVIDFIKVRNIFKKDYNIIPVSDVQILWDDGNRSFLLLKKDHSIVYADDYDRFEDMIIDAELFGLNKNELNLEV